MPRFSTVVLLPVKYVVILAVLTGGFLLGGCQVGTLSTSAKDVSAEGAVASVTGNIFDIPRVPAKAIDAADWEKDVGFRVAAIVDTDLGTPAADFHAARCRLGWNDEGLLIYMDIHDTTPVEGNELWEGDCVEIFIAREAKANFDRIQYLISPGRTEERTKPRIDFWHIHQYGDIRKTPPDGSKYAARTTEGGWAVELLVPWTALGVTPSPGLEIGVQLQTGNFGSERLQFARWAPQIAGPRKPVDMQRIRLAETASPPVLAAMGRQMHGLNITADSYKPADATLRVVADGSLAGKTAAVEIDGAPVGKVTFGEARHGWAEGTLTWSVSLASGTSPREAVVLLPGGKRETLALGDMLLERRWQFQLLEFEFRPWVFAGENLPQFAFKQPLLADLISGFNYTVKVRYFDADAKPVEKAEKPGRYGAVVEITALGETQRKFFTLYRVPDENALAWWPTWVELEPQFLLKGMPEGFGVDAKVWTDDPGRAFSSEFKWFLRGSLDREGFFASMFAGLAELPEEVLAGQVPLKPSQTADGSHHTYVTKLKQAISNEPVYPYLLVTPKNYDKEPDTRWPLLVFLHGGGQRNLPIETLWREGPNCLAWFREDSPFVVVAPLCPNDEGWTPAAVVAVVDRLIATMRVDPDRVYLTGISMGGFGTWDTAASYPERFAAIAPLCGGMNAEQAIFLKDMPIWAFHGDADDMVPVDFTRRPVKRLQEAGAPRLKYTEMPGVGHHINHIVYGDRELYNWLLQQRRPAKP